MASAPPVVSTRDDNSCLANQPATSAPALVVPDHRPREAQVRMLRSFAGIIRRALETRDHHPLFERPEVIEDDYYRFRQQLRN
jgi:hypothetical protein